MTTTEKQALALQFIIEFSLTAQEQLRRYHTVDSPTMAGLTTCFLSVEQKRWETGECIAGISCGCAPPWPHGGPGKADPSCGRCSGTGLVPIAAIRARARLMLGEQLPPDSTEARWNFITQALEGANQGAFEGGETLLQAAITSAAELRVEHQHLRDRTTAGA